MKLCLLHPGDRANPHCDTGQVARLRLDTETVRERAHEVLSNTPRELGFDYEPLRRIALSNRSGVTTLACQQSAAVGFFVQTGIRCQCM